MTQWQRHIVTQVGEVRFVIEHDANIHRSRPSCGYRQSNLDLPAVARPIEIALPGYAFKTEVLPKPGLPQQAATLLTEAAARRPP